MIFWDGSKRSIRSSYDEWNGPEESLSLSPAMLSQANLRRKAQTRTPLLEKNKEAFFQRLCSLPLDLGPKDSKK